MKKKILILMLGLLLIGINVYAAGDLVVNGKVAVGTSPTTYKLNIHDGTMASVWLQLTTNQTGQTFNDGFFWGIEGNNQAQFWSETGMPIVMIPGAASLGNRTTFTSNGRVGIGTFAPSQKLYVVGNIYATGNVTWGSSRELKEDIRELTAHEAVSALNNLNPQKYYYKADKKDEHIGFIAEDVPELLATKDRKSLDPMDIVAVLTKVTQEQQRITEQQQKIISKLTERLNELEREVKMKGSLASVMN